MKRTARVLNRLAPAVIGLALVACERQPTPSERTATEAKRIASDAAFLRQLEEPRVLQAGAHQVVVLEVPQLESGVLRSVQRCFVWRDAEFKTAAMSCPGQDNDFRLKEQR